MTSTNFKANCGNVEVKDSKSTAGLAEAGRRDQVILEGSAEGHRLHTAGGCPPVYPGFSSAIPQPWQKSVHVGSFDCLTGGERV